MGSVELFGLLASVVVAISLTMSSIIKLRWLNLVGASMFTVYGWLIDALPVWGLNGFIVLANIYYLQKIYASQYQFNLLKLDADSDVIRFWLANYHEDIIKFFPNYQNRLNRSLKCYLSMRDNQTCSIVLLEEKGDNSAEVVVDYAFPEFRDFKTGEFIYKHSDLLTQLELNTLTAEAVNDEHEAYLLKMGFKPQGNHFVYQA